MKSFFGVYRVLTLAALLTSLASNGLAQVMVPSGLVSWWQAETNANDFLGLNSGVLEGGVGFAPGEVGQAFNFTGTNQNVFIPASASLNVANYSGFTLEAWINPADVSQSYPIFGWYTTNADTGVQFQIASSGALYAAIAGTNEFGSADGVVTTNVFQHVALTFDNASGVASIYCNGQIVSQTTFSNIVPQASYDLYIGGQPMTNGGVSFIGEIDEAAIYDRALSSNEVAAIYNAGAAGKSTSAIPPEILTQPTNQKVTPGGTAVFSVLADGTGPLSYQWTFNGKNIAGATSSVLTLTNAHIAQQGSYAVKVASSSVTNISVSTTATLTVNTQTILVYKYSGMETVITTNMKTSTATNQYLTLYTGIVFYVPETTNFTILDWGVINSKKTYWIRSFMPSVFITVPGTNANQSFTVFGDATASYDSNGQAHFNTDVAKGLNSKLSIGTKKTFMFPTTFNTDVTHANPDTQTGNMVVSSATFTFTYNALATQSANNNGQTVSDLVNNNLQFLKNDGYKQGQ
jgi:hypothetical protein